VASIHRSLPATTTRTIAWSKPPWPGKAGSTSQPGPVDRSATSAVKPARRKSAMRSVALSLQSPNPRARVSRGAAGIIAESPSSMPV
jgi:hypothetical protein